MKEDINDVEARDRRVPKFIQRSHRCSKAASVLLQLLQHFSEDPLVPDKHVLHFGQLALQLCYALRPGLTSATTSQIATDCSKVGSVVRRLR